MSGQFEGRVAFITGAARGQGRSHAVRFAEEGADIIAVDLCGQIDSVGYPMTTREDLDETVNLVEKTGRRIVAEQGDVRDFERTKAVVAEGVAELGRLDFVLANAGILPAFGEQRHEMAAFDDSVAVLLNGVYYTIEAALPYLLSQDEGGAIVITSSTAGLNSLCPTLTSQSRGMAGYHAGKHGVVGLMRYYATSLAEKNIRVNTVHPTGVPTGMQPASLHSLIRDKRPDLAPLFANALPIVMAEAIDISNAVLYLVSDESRYVTGLEFKVDAGVTIR